MTKEKKVDKLGKETLHVIANHDTRHAGDKPRFGNESHTPVRAMPSIRGTLKAFLKRIADGLPFRCCCSHCCCGAALFSLARVTQPAYPTSGIQSLGQGSSNVAADPHKNAFLGQQQRVAYIEEGLRRRTLERAADVVSINHASSPSPRARSQTEQSRSGKRRRQRRISERFLRSRHTTPSQEASRKRKSSQLSLSLEKERHNRRP